MSLCQMCRDTRTGVKLRNGDEMLCERCEVERLRIVGERHRRMNEASSSSSVTEDEVTDEALLQAEGTGQGSSSETSAKSHARTSSTNQETPDTNDLCITGCRHRTRGGGELIRCCLCGKWYHIKCLKLTKEECAGLWPCSECRNIAGDVKTVKNNMQTLVLTVQKLVDSHSRELIDLRNRCDKLEQDNITLLAQNKSLEVELAALRNVSSTQHEGPSLLIGSSLIRDIDAAKLEDTKVVSLPGGRIDDVTEYLTKTDTKFKSITLVVGGNDCAARTDPEPVAELVQKYSDMTKEAKRLADDIRVSTVIPRITDTENVSERIDAMNAGLVSMCHSENHTIINNDNFFKLRDGEINDGYFLADGTHLTKSGTNRLAKTLNLKIRSSANMDVTKKTRKTYTEAVARGSSPTYEGNNQAHVRTQATGRRRNTQANQNATLRPRGNPSNVQRPAGRENSFNTQSREERPSRPRHDDARNHHLPEPNYAQTHQDSDLVSSNYYYPLIHDLPRCYNCFETNHMIDSCRHKSKVTCFKCNGLGHKEKHCY